MKTVLSMLLFFILTMPVYAEQLAFSQYIKTGCYSKQPANPVLVLDSRFVNTAGSTIAPTSCKGDICWTWKVLQKDMNRYEQQIFSSNLPLKISNAQKLSELVSQTIKQSQGLKKDASALTSAAQEFISTNFSAGRDKSTVKEKSDTQQESKEQVIETNITPLFHLFLSKALQGNEKGTVYYFCHASAVDLFLQAYESDRVNDLVHAFVLYKTVKPEDVEVAGNDQLSKAKLLYSKLKKDTSIPKAEDFAWAQAVLFSELLNWKEFESLKQQVNSELQKLIALNKKEIQQANTANTEKPADKTKLKGKGYSFLVLAVIALLFGIVAAVILKRRKKVKLKM